MQECNAAAGRLQQDGPERLRAVLFCGISAADPLNLTGIVTPGDRIPALSGNRILYEDGVPVLALVAGQVVPLGSRAAERVAELTQALVRRPMSPALRAHLGMSGVPAGSLSLAERQARRQPKRSAAARSLPTEPE